jgi:hypothetical protein
MKQDMHTPDNGNARNPHESVPTLVLNVRRGEARMLPFASYLPGSGRPNLHIGRVAGAAPNAGKWRAALRRAPARQGKAARETAMHTTRLGAPYPRSRSQKLGVSRVADFPAAAGRFSIAPGLQISNRQLTTGRAADLNKRSALGRAKAARSIPQVAESPGRAAF